MKHQAKSFIQLEKLAKKMGYPELVNIPNTLEDGDDDDE